MTSKLYKILLFPILLTLATLVVIKGIANYYADERNRKATPEELEQAITWNPKHFYALGEMAKHHSEKKEHDKAEDFAFRSLANNPTYGLATTLMLNSASEKKDEKLAEQAADFSRRLWPAHTKARSKIAQYWATKRRIDKVLPEWDAVLSQERTLYSTLFPAMFQLTQSTTMLELFSPYAKKPSTWWESFFIYLTKQKNNIDSLQWLYQARLESEKPLSNNERRNYIERLLKEKLWTTSYFGWLSGLEKVHQQYLQYKLYDGGFESELHNTGFDWYYHSNKVVSIRPDITREMHGKSALHIAFKKRKPISFKQVYQRLLLSPGNYTIKMRSRVDRLKTNKGLIWRLRCLADQANILAEGRSLLGSSPWKEDKISFVIPKSKDCQAQLLRLEASSPYAHNQVFSGSIWFDDFQIQAAPPPEGKAPISNKQKAGQGTSR